MHTLADGVKRTSRLRLALKVAGIIISVAMVLVLVRALRRDGPAALDAWRAAEIRWRWVITSITCALAGHAIYILGWRRLLRDVHTPVSFWQLTRMFLVSNLGRYLPGGKAWQMAIVAMVAAERSLQPAIIAATSLFQGVVGMGVGATVLLAAGGAAIGVSSWWLLVLAAGVVGLVALPAVLRVMPRIRSAILLHLHGIDSVTAGTMWAIVWTAAASWILWGLALYALASGLFGIAGAPASVYVAAWTGSFMAGLIAIVSPAGLGAREEVMQAILVQAGMATTDVLMIAVVARVGVTLLDVAPALAVLAVRRRRPGVDTIRSAQPTEDRG